MAGFYRVVDRDYEADGWDRQVVDQDTRERERDSLYGRLDAGYRKVEQGLVEGEDVADWEAYWHKLLREYEQICDDLNSDLAA